jgi:hypothetical protein
MHVTSPREAFPEPDTVCNPAVFYDGSDAFVCYEASERAGGGNVVLKFGEVIDFRVTPMNVEGLEKCRYPVEPWAFNEIFCCEETIRWKVLGARLWLISFNDVMVEVIFETVSLISRDANARSQDTTLMNVVSALKKRVI